MFAVVLRYFLTYIEPHQRCDDSASYTGRDACIHQARLRDHAIANIKQSPSVRRRAVGFVG